MLRQGETICALATSAGGAIAVVRISGPDSFPVIEKVFFPSDKSLVINKQPGNTVIHGEIRDEEVIIDEVLVALFRKPRSYTGEDSVEISCHSSSYIRSRILELLIRNGTRVAAPGEFTQRAFLNGKIDLSQAEAVADLVASSSEASHRIAMNQMRGGFSAEISRLRSELLRLTSLIELELDFGEEDVQFADRNELLSIVNQVKDLAGKLASSFRIGNVIKNGIPVTITGKPNSGKSTLLNALLNEERAIVSEIPGTTRDTIEDTIFINGLEYRFIDTAGLRDTSDAVETMGIRRTHEKIMQASVILLIGDISDTPGAINKRANEIREKIKDLDKYIIILVNKIDLAADDSLPEFEENVHLEQNESLLFISAKEQKGLDELRRNLSEIVEKEKFNLGDVIITNLRHYEALSKVSESLSRVEEGLMNGIPEDLVAIDIRHAIHYLGEITGEITTDEILGNIFKNFCIGK